MNREELAAQIFVHSQARTDEITPGLCFRFADEFLEYAEKQREPKACEHPRIYEGPVIPLVGQCLDCGVMTQKPDPPKSERFAREWDVTISPVGWIVDTKFVYNQVSEKIRVREILPGDEK